MVQVNPFVLLPLYWYPSLNAWNGLFSELASYPTIPFTVIINPNDGPGGKTPDPAYLSAITQLNSHPNARVLGYIPVTWSNRSLSDVRTDIDSYAAWASIPGADCRVDGIFFDEAPSSASSVDYMKDITAHARTALHTKDKPKSKAARVPPLAPLTPLSASSPPSRLGQARRRSASLSSSPYIMFNPGTAVSDAYYDLADGILAIEQSFSNFSQQHIDKIQPAQRAKSIAAIYNFAGSSKGQHDLASQLMRAGLGGICVTDSPDYTASSGLLSALVETVAPNGTTKTIVNQPGAKGPGTEAKGNAASGLGRGMEMVMAVVLAVAASLIVV